ncbi:MAG: hypothetical protein IJS66_00810, partial [Bacteroidales bacterium]|nr:hypothetical protein [Bacteroidales bacterium]
MSHRKKVNTATTEAAVVQYENKIAQVVSLVGARKTFIEFGRGSAKTTDIQCERLIDIMYDMPGAPVIWVADTFTNLESNILPAVLEGLARKGLEEGVHYVIEKKPPEFTDKEKEDLPEWLRPHFWKPYNQLVSYKRTLVFYTGLNVRFGSLDRPSTLAGGSYVFVFGDEGKYLRPDRVSNLLKAVRGYYLEFGRSVFYRGQCFTSDVADASHIGEYEWMSKEAANMDVSAILLVLRVGLVWTEAMQEAVAAKDTWLRTGDPADGKKYRRKLSVAEDWRVRLDKVRRRKGADTFYFRASSYVNADILTPEWFADAFASGLPDTNTAILSMRASLSSGDRFYAALSERHFYFDGIDEEAYDLVPMRSEPDCSVLRYLKPDRELRLGVDFGNMCSMCCAQLDTVNGRQVLRVLKFIYTLAPEYIDELGAKFRRFFAPMKCRVAKLFYDRSGNSYQKVGKDQVSQLKRAIEFDESGARTGWVVHLMNRRQGDIRQSEEYNFMQIVMSETNPRLPVIRIDAWQAKPLKLSLELART